MGSAQKEQGGQAPGKFASSNTSATWERAVLVCCPRRFACSRRWCCCWAWAWARQPGVLSGSGDPRVPSPGCQWCLSRSSWRQEASVRHGAGLPVEVCFTAAPWLQGHWDHVPCRRRQGSVVGAEVRGHSQPSSRLGGSRLGRFTSLLFRCCAEGAAEDGKGEVLFLSWEKWAWKSLHLRQSSSNYAILCENELHLRMINVFTHGIARNLIYLWYAK